MILLILLSRPLPPLHTLCQKILDLSVHRTKLILCPLCDLIVKLLGKSQWNLLFLLCFFFLFLFLKSVPPSNYFSTDTPPDDSNTGFHCSRSAVHLYFRKGRPEDCSPLLLFSLHPILQYHSRSICQVPSLPCRQHLPRFSVLHQ